MNGLFELAARLAHDVWPGRQLCEEHEMRDDDHTEYRDMPLSVWRTWHQPHGVLMTAKSAVPGMTWTICVCGHRLATYDAPQCSQ